jgi:hypothetical protein
MHRLSGTTIVLLVEFFFVGPAVAQILPIPLPPTDWVDMLTTVIPNVLSVALVGIILISIISRRKPEIADLRLSSSVAVQSETHPAESSENDVMFGWLQDSYEVKREPDTTLAEMPPAETMLEDVISTRPPTRLCSNCRTEIETGRQFCYRCGTRYVGS